MNIISLKSLVGLQCSGTYLQSQRPWRLRQVDHRFRPAWATVRPCPRTPPPKKGGWECGRVVEHLWVQSPAPGSRATGRVLFWFWFWGRGLIPRVLHHQATSPVLPIFYFETGSSEDAKGFAKLPRLALNVWSLCFSLLSLWDHRCAPPGQAQTTGVLRKAAEGHVYRLFQN